MKKKINKILFRIDDILFKKNIHMNMPVIEEDLGGMIYFATRYRTTHEKSFKEKSIVLLKKLIKVFPEKELTSSFSEGFEGIYWAIYYLHKCEVIENEDILSEMDSYLFESIRIDVKNNYFDLLHGYIGKIQYLLHSNRPNKEQLSVLIDEILNSLHLNSKKINDGLYWLDQDVTDRTTVNFGISHGIPSILIFLVRLHEMGYENPLILSLINGIIKTLFNFRNSLGETSSFAENYVIDGDDYFHEDSLSRLGWCYGDLGVSYSIYYAGHVLNNNLWKKEAASMVKIICKRGLSESSITHYNDDSFFDITFCHGISGVTYMINKLNNWLNDDEVEKRLLYWKKELIKNTLVFLDVEGDIYYPYDKQDDSNSYIIDKEQFLTGIAGVGMVFQTILYDDFEWSYLLSLY